jgi:hypothetical protein
LQLTSVGLRRSDWRFFRTLAFSIWPFPLTRHVAALLAKMNQGVAMAAFLSVHLHNALRVASN